MKTKSLLFLLFIQTPLFAQNVGINTNSPQYLLHLDGKTNNGTIWSETSSATKKSALMLNVPKAGSVGPTFYNNLEIEKNGESASGTIAGGIPLANLGRVTTGVEAGSMLIGTLANTPLHFVTNNQERLKITEAGLFGINNSPTSYGIFSVWANSNFPDKAGIYVQNTNTDPSQSQTGISSSTFGPKGIAFGASSSIGASFVSSGETTNYAYFGTTGDVGVSMGAYTLGGTALRGKATTGKALHTTGSIKMTGIGEAAGRILTSDANGEASWQDPSASSGWSKNAVGDVYNFPFNSVIIGDNQVHPSMSVYNSDIALQVNGGKSSFFNFTGGDVAVKIINGGLFSDEPVEAGTAFYIKSPLGSAAVIDTRYTGVEVKTSAENTLWAAGKFELNNPSSTANAFEIGNNGNGYALTVNNLGASSNASGYFSNSNTSYTANSNIDLELNNGYMKVSGNARTMFEHTTTALNISSNQTSLNYPGMSATDMLVVTHVYNGNYLGAVGVWWDNSTWKIFRESGVASTMPVGEKFNVMVVKR